MLLKAFFFLMKHPAKAGHFSLPAFLGQPLQESGEAAAELRAAGMDSVGSVVEAEVLCAKHSLSIPPNTPWPCGSCWKTLEQTP